MLTSYQASPIAYWPLDAEDIGDGPVCPDCADRASQGITAQELGEDVDEMFIHYYGTPAGFQPASRYGVEEAYGCSGVECVRCDKPIVEPDHSWLEAGEECPECGHVVEIDEVEDVDPNPPVPRWVPCSRCGAGDGEPHRDGCPEIR